MNVCPLSLHTHTHTYTHSAHHIHTRVASTVPCTHPRSSEHGKSSCMPCNALAPGLLWGRGFLFNRRMAEHTANSCCCRHMLAAQPDFREEASALEYEIEQPVTISHSQGSMQASPCTDRTPARALSLPSHFNAPSSLVAWPALAARSVPLVHGGRCRATRASSSQSSQCEMNAIERYWGATKKYLRRHCTYSLPGLRAGLQVALSQSLDDLPEGCRSSEDLPVSPLLT